MFNLTQKRARQIVKDCQHCPDVYHPLKMEVNPRGLKAQVLWQIDVTHIPEFGKLAYAHTYSHVVMATLRTGKAVKDVIQHRITCFSSLAVPKELKLVMLQLILLRL